MNLRSALITLHAAALRVLPRYAILLLEEAYFIRKGEAELRLIECLCRPHQDAIDVGANVGCYSLFMRKYVKRVFAFEPIPWMADKLVRKFGESVTVRQVALSSSTGTAQLHIPSVNGRPVTARSTLSRMSHAAGADILVRTARLDDFYNGQVGFIKIDVEGHEEAVLDGAWGTITRCRPRVLVEIEERTAPGGRDRIAALFGTLGYSAFFFRDGRMQTIANFDPSMQDPSQLFIGQYTNNFLFIPYEDVAALLNDLVRLGYT